MKKLMLAYLLMAASLFGETIRNVEYQLPKTPEWREANRFTGKWGEVVVYLPPGKQAEEFFGVYGSPLEADPHDIKAIEDGLRVNFKDESLRVTLLEQDDVSSIYEWTVFMDKERVAHGVGRFIGSPDGSVMLVYMTQDPSAVDHTRSVWIPLLKKSKLISHS